MTSPPSGLNFTALWSRLTRTWPSRSRVAADRRDGLGDVDAAGRRPGARRTGAGARSTRSATRPMSSRSTTPSVAAALDPRQVEQLADHLDEVAGLDLDLVDPVAHPRRDGVAGRLGLAGQRLGQQAHRRQRRPQLVRQVVDELGPDLLEPAQLGDVLEDEPQAARRRRAAPRTTSVGPSAPADRDLAGRRARPRAPSGRAPRPAGRGTPRSGSARRALPGGTLEERVGGGVGGRRSAGPRRRSSTPELERLGRSPTGRAGSAAASSSALAARSRRSTTAAAGVVAGRAPRPRARAATAPRRLAQRRRTTRRRAR